MSAPGRPWLRSFVGLLTGGALLLSTPAAAEPGEFLLGSYDTADGEQIMRAVQARHQQYPHVYEEQVMVLIDRLGQRDTRRLRRYTRVADDGAVDFLLLFDAPEDVLGVALLARREASGRSRQAFYLPALGPDFIESRDSHHDAHFLGSDFTVESLTGENPDAYRYQRRRDVRLDGETYYRIDVHRLDADPLRDTPLRTHYVRQDILFVVRTDHYDGLGRPLRRQTHHDLVPVGAGVWRPNLLRMENLRDGHQSLLRIERRIFSADLVPAERFTPAWILDNQPPLRPAVLQEGEADANANAKADAETTAEGGS